MPYKFWFIQTNNFMLYLLPGESNNAPFRRLFIILMDYFDTVNYSILFEFNPVQRLEIFGHILVGNHFLC